MAKAARKIKEQLKKVDIIIIMGDARAVRRSVFEDFAEMFKDKKCVYVFNKTDLADPTTVEGWKKYFAENSEDVFFTDCISKTGIRQLVSFLAEAKSSFRFEREVNVMAAGIPNTGKSMLLNSIAGRASAKVENKAGVTRANKWIRVQNSFYLLDTPGVLTPKFDSEEDGFVIAAIGSMKDTVYDKEELAYKIIDFLKEKYPELLTDRYGIDPEDKPSAQIMEEIAEARGFRQKGGHLDLTRTSVMILEEFRNGKIGRIAFDTAEDLLL